MTGKNIRDNNRNVEASVPFGQINPTDHGTHVSGIIIDMSPETFILPVKLGACGHRQGDAIKKGLECITNEYKDPQDRSLEAINISFGVATSQGGWNYNFNAIRAAVNKGKFVILSAGNDGKELEDYKLPSQGNKLLSECLEEL